MPLTAVRAVAAGFPLSDIAIILATLLSYLSFVKARRTTVPTSLVAGTIMAILASVVLATASHEPSEELLVGLRMGFVWLLWGLAITRLLFTQAHVVRAAAAYTLGCGLSAAVALGQYLGFDARPYFFAEKADVVVRFIGLNGHPNGQGGALAIAATLCFAAIFYGVAKARAAVLLAAIMLGIMLSASITGLLAATVGLAFLFVRSGRLKLMLGVAALVLAALLSFALLRQVFPGLVTPLDRISSATGVTGTSTIDQRLMTIQYAWDGIKQSPVFGVGFADGGGTYNGETQAHNMFVLAWYQGGLLLLVAVTVVVLAAIHALWRRSHVVVIEGLAAASVVAVFFAQTGPSLYDRYTWFPVVMLLAATAIYRRFPQESAFIAASGRGRRTRPAPELAGGRSGHAAEIAAPRRRGSSI